MNKEKNITLPLKKWLRYTLGSFPRADVDNDDALLISDIDSDEEFCHVEFPSKENGLRVPRVWWINEWKSTYARYLIEKDRAEKQRKAWCLQQENAARIRKAMALKFGLDQDTVMAVAARIAAKKDQNKADFLGVILDLGDQ